MARIKIADLPEGRKISKEEMRRVRGGFTPVKLGPGDVVLAFAFRASTGYIAFPDEALRAMPTVRRRS